MGTSERSRTPNYTARRALVVAVAAVVVALIVWAGIALRQQPANASGEPASTGQTPAAAPTSESVTTTPESATAAPQSTPPETTPATASNAPAAPVPACDPGTLRLEITGPNVLKPGQTADFAITATNPGAESCQLRVTATTFELVVTSGSDTIWRTTDCQAWSPDQTVTLAAGEKASWTTSWNRTRSEGCKTVPGTLGAGTYVATAQIVGGVSARHVFRLVW